MYNCQNQLCIHKFFVHVLATELITINDVSTVTHLHEQVKLTRVIDFSSSYHSCHNCLTAGMNDAIHQTNDYSVDSAVSFAYT